MRTGRWAGAAIRRAGIAGAILTAGVARAAEDGRVLYPGSAQPTAPEHAAGGVNALTLGLALLLALAGVWVIWRKRRGGSSPRETSGLAIQETRALGNRQYLVVAAYEGRKFLLGVCPGRIDMLAPLNERRPAEPTSP